MDKQKKQPNIKVNFSQAGKEATFRLTEKEYKLLINATREQHYERWGMMHNFSAFAWADYGLSRSKGGRFNSIFNYHKGDVMWERVD